MRKQYKTITTYRPAGLIIQKWHGSRLTIQSTLGNSCGEHFTPEIQVEHYDDYVFVKFTSLMYTHKLMIIIKAAHK